MVFYIFAFVVFIAEIIIALTIISNLLKLSRCVNKYSEFLSDANPKIRDLMLTVTKLSEQAADLSPIFKEKIKVVVMNSISSWFKNMLSGLIFIYVKNMVIKKGKY